MSEYISTIHRGMGFGNKLYLLLQAYIRSLNSDKNVKFVIDISREIDVHHTKNNISELNKLKLDKWFTTEKVKYESLSSYFQNYGIDFTKEQLNSFIENTIAKSDIYKSYKPIDDRIIIQIRGGDYKQLKHLTQFNFKKYLITAIDIIGKDFKIIDVCTDDISYAKSIIEDSIIDKKITVNYLTSDYLSQFMTLSFSKYKIIWNSTFSSWASYISDYMFKNDEHITIAPSHFFSNASYKPYNPEWNIIEDVLN